VAGAGTGVQTLDQEPPALDGRFLFLEVEDRPQELVQLVGLDAGQGFLFANELLLDHVHGDLNGRESRPFPDPALEHIKLPLLDGELDVHHVGIVLLQDVADLFQLGVGLGVVLGQLAIGSGVRVPATTSSPWAFIRYSP